jgi:hypothetical protein
VHRGVKAHIEIRTRSSFVAPGAAGAGFGDLVAAVGRTVQDYIDRSLRDRGRAIT